MAMHSIVDYTQKLANTFSKQGTIADVESTSTSSKAYAVGDFFYYEGILYKVTSSIAQGDSIVTSGSGQNVEVDTVGEELVDLHTNYTSRDLLKSTVGWTGKNKNSLPYYEMSKTYNGIKYDVLDGGTVIANRTGSAQDSNLVLHYREKSYAYPLILPNGHYFVTGCPAGGSESTYYIEAVITKNGARQVLGYDTGNGLEIDLTGDDYSNTETCLGLTIQIKSATATVSNLTFTPMVSDTTGYEPYHDSVEDTLRDAEVIEPKNLMGSDVYLFGTSDAQIGASTFTTAGGGTGYVAKLDNNTDYVISRVGGNRSRIALSVDFPVSGGACYIINVDNDVTDKSFNSGNYNYVYIYASNTSQTYETIQPMVCTQAEWDKSHDYEPYYVPVKELAHAIPALEETGAVNLLPNNATSQVLGGVTWTKNADGTVTPTGSPSGNSDFVIYGTSASSSGSIALPDGIKAGKKYIASINNAVPSNAQGQMKFYFYDASLNMVLYKGVNFSQAEVLDIPNNATRVFVELYFASSWAISAGTKFYPQVVPYGIGDKVPYQPYAMTNRELTDKTASMESDITTLTRSVQYRVGLSNVNPSGVIINNAQRHDSFVVIWQINSYGAAGMFWLAWRYDDVAIIKDISGDSSTYFTASLVTGGIKLRVTGAGGGTSLLITTTKLRNYTFTNDNT